jgi:hypothetical protein
MGNHLKKLNCCCRGADDMPPLNFFNFCSEVNIEKKKYYRNNEFSDFESYEVSSKNANASAKTHNIKKGRRRRLKTKPVFNQKDSDTVYF